MKLLVNALVKFLSGLLLVGLLLFLPAGTVRYPGGWRFMALLFLPMLVFGALLFMKAPEMLKKRLNTRETEPMQKGVVVFSALVFIAAFLLAGLDFRFHWTSVPPWLTIAASLLMLAAYGLYMEVMRENAYLSRTVEIQEGQKVIDTGLYGVVRHPMYTSTILLYLSIPLVLGSWVSFAVFLLYPAAIVFRIRSEEQVLSAGLAGYMEYKEKVKYRLVPYIW
ncbi:MAG: isoprenylcysteine carboxylmethyltransferase family protein [Oscillospiraceae bacterium]|nr:isoprenylcysteine carboxylmethyltransferase family protein [Oscillospiraceae bacterium]